MASLALHLKSHHHKPSQILHKSTSSNLTFSLFFSSSSSSDNSNNNGGGNPFSSYFDDIKSKLKHHEEQLQQQQQQQSPGFRQSNNSLNPLGSSISKKDASFDEIRKNLSEFRHRSTVPPPNFAQKNPTLFQNLGGNAGNPNVNAEKKPLSFDSIRESLRKMKGKVGEDGGNTSDKMSLNNYRRSFKQQPTMPSSGGGVGVGVGVSKLIGGSSENLPMSVFGKEMKEKEMKAGGAGDSENDEANFDLFRMYTHDELGMKLRELRPEVKGKKKGGEEESWFSISELSERLKKLKEIEKTQASSTKDGIMFTELRKSISKIDSKKDNKRNNGPIQSFSMLTQSSFTQSPPKEHLVEKYFHPDNMSAEEKLKLELKKVRDEFKMHESDCGSTRVQIAQLTTEILHLSSVLHKKDKHSRRGLQAKVQQRKKLLKYLRRTDWESYCFVLSKLGLRDNPDYKN